MIDHQSSGQDSSRPVRIERVKKDCSQSELKIRVDLTYRPTQRSLATIAAALVLGSSFCLAVYDPACRSAFFSMVGSVSSLLLRSDTGDHPKGK
jgi:hypothetical protein